MAKNYITIIFKRLILALSYAFIFFIFVCPWTSRLESAEVVDRIVAVVNDDIITLFELNRALLPYAERIKAYGYLPEKEKEVLYKLRDNILDQLIDQKIEDQEIKRFKMSVSEEEIDQTIERIKEANFYTDEDLRTAVARDGLSMEEYRDQIKEQMLRSKLVNREIKSKIVITHADVKTYYDNNLEKYGGEKKYHLKNIIMALSPFIGEVEKQKIKAKMEEVLEKLKEGEPFETMVATYSESPLAAEGGDLGLFSLDQLAPQLRDVIKMLKPGDYTPVIETDQGYQLFLVQDIVQTPAKSLEAVTPEIENILFNKIVNQKFESWLIELRKQSHIKKIK